MLADENSRRLFVIGALRVNKKQQQMNIHINLHMALYPYKTFMRQVVFFFDLLQETDSLGKAFAFQPFALPQQRSVRLNCKKNLHNLHIHLQTHIKFREAKVHFLVIT